LKQLLRKLGITAKESIIIAFLTITFIAGLIIRYSGWNRPEGFSYSGTDKQFEEKTKQSFDLLKKQSLSGLQKERSDEIKNFADSIRTETDSRKNNKIVKLDRAINLNNAYTADLQLLPGIGEVMAERIIEYREKTGGFKNIEELKNVKGIGEKKFEMLKPFVTVE
jgi:comEA protein